MSPRIIDENASHELRCDAKKLRPVLPAHAVLLGELQEELIYRAVGCSVCSRRSRRR